MRISDWSSDVCSSDLPDDYAVIEQLAREEQLTVRIAYNLFTQKPKEELTDFKNWTGSVKLHQGDDFLRHNGAGEMQIGRASCRKECVSTCRSRWSPYH